MNKELADLLFPNITKDTNYYEELYPERNLAEGAIVTRFAPSPTGFVHMGSLRTTFIARKVANDTNGVFFLRIEDTDQKREVENGIQGIVDDFKNFDFKIDEGRIGEYEEIGNYGPYLQSERVEIYQTFAKLLVEKGLAYPCFCSEEALDETRKIQELNKERLGYYGSFATCRNLTIDQIKEHLNNGEKFVTRLKSPGNFNNRVFLEDLVKGKIEFPENDLDVVLLKSDGIPTYHFAHAVDDHLMRTTHVIRGEEWLSSLPIHVQLFNVLGFELPSFVHVTLVNKKDGEGVRKLSKRKDPEAALSYYHERGIPVDAVYLYLMTTANSNFEEWLDSNPDKTLDDFKFDFKKMSSSGSLFDLDKLLNISKNYISRLKADEVYNNVLTWAGKYDTEFYQLLDKYKDYSIKLFNIERECEKPRKDYEAYSSIKSQVWYMYDELFNPAKEDYEFKNVSSSDEISMILTTYVDKYYSESDDQETWFSKMKALCDELGYASNMKEYKANPENFKGNVADISTVIRVALTTKSMTPNLYDIMQLLGTNRIKQRINYLNNL